MGTYHYSQGIVQRSKGHAVTKAASYITAEPVKDEIRVKTFDYSRKEEVVAHGIEIPTGYPAELQDVGNLANAIELSEKSSKAQLAVRGNAALPSCNTLEENIALIRDHVQPWKDKGFIVLWGVHENEGNPHFHYLVTQRKIEMKEDGSWKWAAKYHKEYQIKIDGVKQKEYVTPARFKELKNDGVNVEKIKGGKDKKPISRAANDGFDSSKEALLADRQRWEKLYNASTENHYKTLGIENPEEEVSCRSYADRGIDKLPQKHEGPIPEPEVLEYNAAVKEYNSITDRVLSAIQEVKENLAAWWNGVKPAPEVLQRRKHIAHDHNRALAAAAKHKHSQAVAQNEKEVLFKGENVHGEPKKTSPEEVRALAEAKKKENQKEYSPFDDVPDFNNLVKQQDKRSGRSINRSHDDR